LDREFEARLRQVPAPEVFAWHDVYVNRLGQVWNQEGQVLFSRRGPIREASRAAMDGALRLPEAAHALGSGDGNFYHWFRDALAALAWRLAPGAPAIPLLVRDDAPGFVAESLTLLGEAQAPVLVGDAVFVHRLYHADIDIEAHVYADAFEPIYARMRAAAAASGRTGGGPRLYISRRDSGRRPLRNEAELEQALSERGFRSLSFAELDLAAQMRAVQEADVILAPHGAGLAHLIAARPGTRVMELLPLFAGDRAPMSIFARLSRVRHLRHTLWLQPVAAEASHWQVRVADIVDAIAATCE
jgi:capsular polysaccharide biosynthesis protein